MQPLVDVTEQKRLNEAREAQIPWKKWGPYLSERQWGTVREDYSHDGNAWDYFSHDQARSRAYRWGEDGLGGICDEKQRLCFALALWNERDPILKERLFGLGRERDVGLVRGLRVDRPGRPAAPGRGQLRRPLEPVLRDHAMARPGRTDLAAPRRHGTCRLRP